MRKISFLIISLFLLYSESLIAQTYGEYTDTFSVKYNENEVGILYKNSTPILAGTIPPGGRLYDYKVVRFMVYSFGEDGSDPALFWSKGTSKPWQVATFPTPKGCGGILAFTTKTFKIQGHALNGGIKLKCGDQTVVYSFKVRMNENSIPIRISVFVFDGEITEWYREVPQ